MRSHNSAEIEEKSMEPIMKKIPSPLVGGEFANGQTSYGLRENPRKTWRASDANYLPLPLEKVCKQCGKGFQSLKALCGHMACHSERDKGSRDDQSWSTSENQKLVVDSHSDTEGEDRVLRTRSSKNKKCKKIVVKHTFPLVNNNNNGSSSISEIDGEEQEEVAMCLMLLSRDYGNKGGVNSVVESSDNNSVILETKSSSIDMRVGKTEFSKNVDDENEPVKKIEDVKECNSDSGYFLDECAKAESDVSVDGYRKNGGFFNQHNKFGGQSFLKSYRAEVNNKGSTKEYEYENNDDRIESRKRRYISENLDSSEKRVKYECFNCKRTFKSYQALGGHRPCHKRTNSFYESRYESGENSLDDDSSEFVTKGKIVESTSKNRKSSAKNTSEKKTKAKKNKSHVCPFCDRVFKNGQALGGHKRSHFIGGHEENNNNHRAPEKKPDLLDLNLPAPQEDEDDPNGRFLAEF